MLQLGLRMFTNIIYINTKEGFMDPFGDKNVLTVSSSAEYAQIRLLLARNIYVRPQFSCIYVMSDGSEAKLMTMKCILQEKPTVFTVTSTDMTDTFKCKNVQRRKRCRRGSENSIYNSSLLSKDEYYTSLLSVIPDNNYENEIIELL